MDRMRTVMVCMMLLAFSLSGCVAWGYEADDDGDQGEIPILIYNETWNDSHQFNSLLGSGHASNYDYNASVNVSIELYWNISYRFEEPLVGSQGYVNVSFEQNGMTLASEEYTGTGWDEAFNFTLTLDGNSSGDQDGFSLVIQSMGSDHGLNGGDQAYYAIQTVIRYH